MSTLPKGPLDSSPPQSTTTTTTTTLQHQSETAPVTGTNSKPSTQPAAKKQKLINDNDTDTDNINININDSSWNTENTNDQKTVHLVDYPASGNIRSLVNAVERCGYRVAWVTAPEQLVEGGGVAVSLSFFFSFVFPSMIRLEKLALSFSSSRAAAIAVARVRFLSP
jgi:hypothetical protein